MGTAERRLELMRKLCIRRRDTISNLACEFGVTPKTIQRDIEELSLTMPIYTKSGRYGGVFVMDGYTMDRMYMGESELALLNKVKEISLNNQKCILSSKEMKILERMIKDYTKPTV